MALPLNNYGAIQWVPYQGNYKNLISQVLLDFTTWSAYAFQGNGTVKGAPSVQQEAANGVCVDNTQNMYNVTITVGQGAGQFIENVPPYSKTIVDLGKSGQYIRIAGSNGATFATFFTGLYPGGLGQQNVLGATTQAINVFLPSGMMMNYAGLVGNVPAGWLYCDGSAVSRLTYASLFGAIGTLYGPGDGSSTFNLPDTQGYFVRGYDAAGENDPGRVVGSTQQSNVGAHYHQTFIGSDGGPNVYMQESASVPIFGSDLIASGNGIEFQTPTSTLKNVTAVSLRLARTSFNALGQVGVGTYPLNVAIPFIIKT